MMNKRIELLRRTTGCFVRFSPDQSVSKPVAARRCVGAYFNERASTLPSDGRAIGAASRLSGCHAQPASALLPVRGAFERQLAGRAVMGGEFVCKQAAQFVQHRLPVKHLASRRRRPRSSAGKADFDRFDGSEERHEL